LIFNSFPEFGVVGSKFLALGNEGVVFGDDFSVLLIDDFLLGFDCVEESIELGSTVGVVGSEVYLGVSSTDHAL
jgi:hypothetical protein